MTVAGYLVAALYFFPAPLLPNERQVPRLAGLSEAEARADLERQGLAVAIRAREPHPTAGVGEVIWQDPPRGVAVPRGDTVHLVLAGGPPRLAMPNVVGYDETFARALLTATGLSVELVDSVDVKDVLPGTVVGTAPAPGESLTVGRPITLHLAR